MKRRFETALLGGALALSGAINRKLGDLERRGEEASAPEPVEAQPAPGAQAAPTTAPPPPSVPGMPLPTGYGLQVRGPQGESIVLPVCLPPGFELDSMMLCPEFLPRVETSGHTRRATDGRPKPLAPTAARPAPTPAPTPAPAAAPVPGPPPPSARPSTGRLDGVLQLVFGADQSFSHSIDHTDDTAPVEHPPPVPTRVPEPRRL